MGRGRVRPLRAEERCSKWNCANRRGIYWGKSLRCTIHQEYRIKREEPPEPVSKPVKVEKVTPVQLKLFGTRFPG